MGINWTNYFSKKYIFFIELGKTHQEVVEILKRNLKHHKKNKKMWKGNKDKVEYKKMMKALKEIIKNKEALVS